MANKKGTGVKGKGAKTKKEEKPEQNNDNKVVKFEKKNNTPEFNGQITYIKIPVKKEIPIIMYKRENDRGTKEITFKSIGRDGRIYRGLTEIMPLLFKRRRNP